MHMPFYSFSFPEFGTRIHVDYLFSLMILQNTILQAIEKDGTIVQALRARRQVILDNIRDNDEAGANYCKVHKLQYYYMMGIGKQK